MANHTTRAQRINARQDKIWEEAMRYRHLREITVCPVCGDYKRRDSITCGKHPDNPRICEIVDDYEKALANRAHVEATKPLRPATPQKPCDVGLFSDEKDQIKLV